MKHFTNARFYSLDPQTGGYTVASSLTVDGERIVALNAEAGAGVRRVDLGGATVVPAFADAHVHLDGTGLRAGSRDLGQARDAASFERMVAALPRGRRVYACGYDDATWPDGPATSRALQMSHADARALLVRVDGHSSIVNRATLAWLNLRPETTGLERDESGEPTGRLSLDANWIAQERFFADAGSEERRAAIRRACEAALAQGIVHLHAQIMGLGSAAAYRDEVEFLRSLPGVRIHPKICERDPALAKSLGLRYVGGDVFLDGSLGSGTAALEGTYHDRPGCGTLALSDAEAASYFAEAQQLGVGAGVHAIGDRAIEQALHAIEQATAQHQAPRARHFIEHAELTSDEHLARCAQLGVHLSMQPQFDATWGAPGGMYESRLGTERASGMNRLRSALRAGVVVAGGSDSPVCRLSALDGMRAAVRHHATSERLQPADALTIYTDGAARLVGIEERAGRLAPGFDADFTVLDRDPVEDGRFDTAQILETWCAGKRVWPHFSVA